MTDSLKRPLVAITGASAGIGASTARRFAKEGYRLALISRRREKLTTLQKELPKGASIYALDICNCDAVAATFARIEKQNGPIDVLVNNAGCAFGLDLAHEAELKEWEQCLRTNINGLLYCTKAVLSSMVKRNKGHIINLGSTAGTYPYPGGNVYAATKAFVREFSLNLRADLLGKNVRVSCVEPGLVGGTEFSMVRFRGNKKLAAKVYDKAKALSADDVAEVIYFCHSLPPHVNINTIEMMPVCQASAALSIYRNA